MSFFVIVSLTEIGYDLEALRGGTTVIIEKRSKWQLTTGN